MESTLSKCLRGYKEWKSFPSAMYSSFSYFHGLFLFNFTILLLSLKTSFLLKHLWFVDTSFQMLHSPLCVEQENVPPRSPCGEEFVVPAAGDAVSGRPSPPATSWTAFAAESHFAQGHARGGEERCTFNDRGEVKTQPPQPNTVQLGWAICTPASPRGWPRL